MARKRFIAPEFFTHGDLFDAEAHHKLPLRLAYAGLWTVSDRRGLFSWRPRELKLSVLPYDNVDFADVLAALEEAGFIRRYVVDGEYFGIIPGFAKWQSFHPHEKPSNAPEPTNGRFEPTKVRTDRGIAVAVTTTTTASTTASTLSAGAGKPTKVTWVTPFCNAWEEAYGGEMSVAPALTPLDKLVKKHGASEVLLRFQRYVKITDARYASVQKFASTWSAWDGSARKQSGAGDKISRGREALAEYVREAEERDAAMTAGQNDTSIEYSGAEDIVNG